MRKSRQPDPLQLRMTFQSRSSAHMVLRHGLSSVGQLTRSRHCCRTYDTGRPLQIETRCPPSALVRADMSAVCARPCRVPSSVSAAPLPHAARHTFSLGHLHGELHSGKQLPGATPQVLGATPEATTVYCLHALPHSLGTASLESRCPADSCTHFSRNSSGKCHLQ